MIKFSEEVHGYMRAIHGGITKILFAPFRDAGLTPPQAFTLGCIRQLGDGATVGDVCRELKTPLSNTTNITLRLEKTGLITRRRDENDRRNYHSSNSGYASNVIVPAAGDCCEWDTPNGYIMPRRRYGAKK